MNNFVKKLGKIALDKSIRILKKIKKTML